jgi:hypothetical protein
MWGRQLVFAWACDPNTLVLAEPTYFRHTESSGTHEPATVRHNIHRHRPLARHRHRQ